MKLLELILGAMLTLAGGVGALLLTKLFVDPLNEQKKVIAEITSSLFYWARIYVNPIVPRSKSPDIIKAEVELRALAGKLIAATAGVRPYRLALWLGAPSPVGIDEAAGHFIAISNCIDDPTAGAKNYERANSTLARLRINAKI